jgi:hypothetical protein
MGFFGEAIWHQLGVDARHQWGIEEQNCPSCGRKIIRLACARINGPIVDSYHVYPRRALRQPLSPDVPELFSNDYLEACNVFDASAKASAALSRRCLQNIIREHFKMHKSDLSKEIDELLNSKQLPTHLAQTVDAIRGIGNFAAHPIKSTNTGEIIDVESGEAEWSLDTLEGLFDFCFVQPAILQRKRDELNKKLTDAGKPLVK